MLTALIFRERLLAPSETFIAEQARALRRYRPVLAGLRRTKPNLCHSLSEVLLRDGDGPIDKLAANLYRRFPFANSFFERLRAENPSIIHAHFAVDAVQALPIARALKVPLVVSLHGFDVTSSEQSLSRSNSGRHYWKHRERLFAEASAFICVSDFVRRAALKAGLPEHKLHVHYTGIDCGRFQVANVERDPKLVLFVGRLVEVKGCEYLLRAMEQVQRHDPDAHLEIIGDGPLRARLEGIASELSLRVCFRGVQSSDEVLRSMSRARVLCNPSATASTGDMEGFGMVFAEAQAVGTPVVSFLHGGIPEAVKHGETGLLCAEGNVAKLAESLVTLLADDVLWNKMSNRAQQWVRERFDISKQNESLETLYDECVGFHRRTNQNLQEGEEWGAGHRHLERL